MIYDISPVNNYQGNNNATIFDFDFYIDNENQLKVYLFDEKGTKIELKNTIDYLIEGVQSDKGGYITFPLEDSEYSILTDEQKISLELDLPVSQETQYNNSSLLNLESLEYSFDYLTRLIQILKRKLSLCVKVEECSENSPQELIDMINEANITAQYSANQAYNFKNEVKEIYNNVSKDAQNVSSALSSVNDFKDELLNSGMYKFCLFDTKISDHILEGEEAKGWALQGTYATKESYPDFYNKCLEEYQNSNEAIIGVEPWIQPIATANTTAIDGGNMVISASSEYSGENAWKAFDGNNASTHFAFNSKNSGWWQVKFPYKLLIKGLTYYSRGKASTYPVQTATFYTSSDMTQQIGDTFSAPTADYTAFEVQNIPQDGIVTDTIYLTMNGSGSTCGMGELVINAQKLTSDIYYTIYKNNNGHKFYPIEQKSSIDDIYNQYGIADFYGIDEENERVFLPRNKYFQQLTDDVSKVNEMVEAGLPNFSGTISLWGANLSASGDIKAGGSSTFGTGTGTSTNTATIDLSNASSIYGNSDTVQPPSSLKLLYYCVGNTEVTQAITNVTEVTTSDNDTIPLFAGMYFDFKPNNVSWLKAGEQQNSAGIYKTCYDTLVEIVNGVNNYDLKVINQEDMVSGVVYDEYWILDQDNMTFRTPLTIATKSLSGKVAGNGMTLGLTNGINNFGLMETYNQSVNNVFANEGAFDVNVGSFSPVGWNSETDQALGVTTDPTKSGIIANQSTAQLYFKVANAVQNLELLDAGEVLEGLSGKVGFSDTEWAANACMPSGKYIDLTLGSSGTTYTAPANGWFAFSKDTSGGSQRVGLFNKKTNTGEGTILGSSSFGTATGQRLHVYIPAKIGDIIEVTYNAGSTTNYFRFIYAEGEV